ncbi:MAG: hypothetical protein KHZ27_04425 [Fusobacterium sp.]|nr:hypothetical protein [Fusobacterium sp.]
MKKLALLLGALSLVSSVAYAKEVVPAVEEVVVVEEAAPVAAAPALTVTYVGQNIEVDNWSGSKNGDIGNVMFGNSVGLAYGDDWTFDFFARKGWDMDTDKGTQSNGHRLQLDAWRNYENYSLGFRFRGEKDTDKYYLRGKYNYGMFSGFADVAYASHNGVSGNEDGIYIETIPVAVTVGPVTLAYYLEADEFALDTRDDGFNHSYRQQLRASMPLYNGEKLSLGLEYRWQFDTDVDYDKTKANEKVVYNEANENSHIVVLSAAYAVTENLTVSGYYQYDMYDYDTKNSDKDLYSPEYYGEFGLGWTYSF